MPSPPTSLPPLPPSASTSTTTHHHPQIYPQAILLSVLAWPSFLLTLPPLLQHARKRNLPTTTLILSFSLLCLQNAVNPIIWPNDDVETWVLGYGLCDVEAKLQVGLSIAIPGSAACVCRHLARILGGDSHEVGSGVKRGWDGVVEWGLCVVVPVCVMALHVLVQPYRYFVFGIAGCQFAVFKGWVSVVVVLVWPVVISLVGVVYSVIVVVRVLRHWRQVEGTLAEAQVGRWRFARVFVLVTLLVVAYAPVALYIYIISLDGVDDGWSWEKVHPPGWSESVVKVRSDGVVRFDRWVQVASGFLQFLVYGLGNDAVAMYRSWAGSIGLTRLWRFLRTVMARRAAGVGDRLEQPEPSERIDRHSWPSGNGSDTIMDDIVVVNTQTRECK